MHRRTGKPKFNGSLAVSFLALVSAQAIGAVPGLEAEKSWDLDGYVKYMATYSIPEKQSNTLDHLIHNRFNFEYRFSPSWHINIGIRNRALWGDALDIEQYPQLVALDNGYFDISKNWREDGVILNTQIDRLYISWQQDDWRGLLGRFRVNWSMNTIWNPNDIYNAYSIYDFDYEERAGTDAVMASKTLDFASGIDLVFAPAKKPAKNSLSLRYFANKSGWDYQVIAGRSKRDFVLGAGFATDIYEAGIRGELSWFDPIDSQFVSDNTERTMVGSLEADYSFGGSRSWLGRVAWLYISEPQKALSALAYLNLPLDAKTLSFTQHTLYTDMSFDLTSLNRFTASISYYDDGSFFSGLSNSYSLATDWQLLTVLQSFNGTSDSLFGETPAVLLYANIRYSF
ncbi:hypothetical protein [Vibrio sp. B1FLJ16]|uniref:hypothetical protein n=1 Tax=Vibrio sp. B1FLJ16 TaxID=2751178 RepID=UPI0015F747CD|nr:hypothetical protein [Vibrio sp. B1FLJ16]CAD7818290.1 hypothetical protein ACOMICROBIO_EPCKBFOG_03342 [Vibrio sp. B1FLJ16]CAE6934009.1 hypothetical protein ACOMICROBIO_EPCKBFOG_03342 [Vibrio sp. B1FLJ16]